MGANIFLKYKRVDQMPLINTLNDVDTLTDRHQYFLLRFIYYMGVYMGICYFLRFNLKKIFWCLKKDFPLRLLLCDIDLKEIPTSTIFSHPIGIVIRSGTIIGENCSIHQNVTIGQRRSEEERTIIGNKVIIGAGAIILGGVTIGNNSTIAAGSIVLDDIPSNCVYISKHIPLTKRKGDQDD